MKSDASAGIRPNLSDGAETSDSDTAPKMGLCEKIEEEDVHTHKTASPEPSCVSMKSDVSMGIPPDLSDGAETSDPQLKRDDMIRSVMRRNVLTAIYGFIHL
ncbi:hypothetical protein G5714_016675 [Onychostoma macrolepis]|uniref:Uncharacterized protein n=1 Tax=Onychostoma macrolepis TaxID=369639 RepID=A0A7J6C5H4_9TELE|nr:hypothetical protein G5714_016675 [Onychostoma macrolepis]